MIHATVKIELSPDKHDEALQILRPIVDRIRNSNSCISCSIYQDIEEAHLIVLEQFWESEEGMTRHLRSQDYQKILIVMEMAMKPPEIQFNTITGSTGVETIEKARMSK
ncbi:MAG: antibiotic biosynthesis monooxygenase [Deltaproteobacteria bacterium]|nr:antibiotic biosynthesis monooxygenase [Deltaproteobacteria bacterium]